MGFLDFLFPPRPELPPPAPAWPWPHEVENAYLDLRSEVDLCEAYYRTLETHLRAHGCEHAFSEIANEGGGIPEEKVK